jgi:kynurenine formamidase
MKLRLALICFAGLNLLGCSQSEVPTSSAFPQPKEIIDLGALVTEDLPERVWGKGFMAQMEFTESNTFDVISWDFGPISGSNAYYKIFNHGGPHVDAPNHMGLGSGIDSYAIESFIGPAKVIDMSHLAAGRSVTKEMLEDRDIEPGDIVLMYTDYVPPQTESALPESITLNFEASEYLASIPIRAFGTDAFAVDSLTDESPVVADSEIARTMPAHYSFLSRGIPAYEQLMNMDRLLGKSNLFFVGVPLNIANGDGMIVRPVVFVY